MKKIIMLCIATALATASFANDFHDIDKKHLMQAFIALFPNAQEVNWYERHESYEVHFVEGGIRTRITYRKDGLLVQFLRHYEQKNLPSYIQYRIRNEYPDKTIFGVTELSTISGPDKNVKVEYNIKLLDTESWWTVRIDTEGNLKVTEKFKKAF